MSDSAMRVVRHRALRRLLIIGSTGLAGACFGGRTKPPAATGPAAAPATRRDSTADTALKTLSDSARADSIAAFLRTAARDAGRRDSIARDSAAKAKGDTAKGKAKPAARTKECLLDFTESPPESRAIFLRQSATSNNVFIGGGFVGHCQGEKNRIRADSAEHFADAGFLNLFGNVVYEETGNIRVTAAHATYFTRDGKLFADGNVVATQVKTGSTFTGPNMEYYRVMPGTRAEARLFAPNNPRGEIRELDKGNRAGPPVFLTAATMESRGDSVLYGWGQVQFTREQVQGNSDSASFDKTTGRARLLRQAHIQSRDKDRPFQMFGDTIDLYTTQRERALDRVVARHRGIVTSNDLKMLAEIVDLRLSDQKINRAYAFGPGRATTETSGQTLVADSMDILLPAQRIRELHAIGAAVATGLPDSTKMKSDERDELHGDTVLAFFDSLRTLADTAEKPTIREVQARGSATSKFQIASKQGRGFPPAVSYARGKRIVLAFDSGAIRMVSVDSQASGIYLEPVTDSLADTTRGAAKPVRRPPPAAPQQQDPAPSAFLPSQAFRRRQ